MFYESDPYFFACAGIVFVGYVILCHFISELCMTHVLARPTRNGAKELAYVHEER